MTSDTDRDPALGHAEDFPEDAEDEHQAGGSSPYSYQRVESDSVLGVPLMDGERRVHEGRPSWWLFLPEMLLTGFMYGILGSFLVWLYTPFITYEFPAEVMEAFDTVYGGFAQVITSMGFTMSPEFSIPWWVWIIAFLLASYPVMRAYLRARFTHYVITTDRVMAIKTFPGKNKDWAEIRNLRSFTSDADFIEQRLGVGSVKFQPANEDPIVFAHMDDYEYWESEVKEIRKAKDENGAVDTSE